METMPRFRMRWFWIGLFAYFALCWGASRARAADGLLRPILGAPDHYRVSAQVPAHARAWVTSRGWQGDAYAVTVATGGARVSGLFGWLMCSGPNRALATIGPPSSPPRNAALTVALAPQSGYGPPCWAAMSWEVPGIEGSRVSWAWEVEALSTAATKARPGTGPGIGLATAGLALDNPPPSPSSVAYAPAPLALSQAWPPAIHSLPYRIECDPLAGCRPTSVDGGAGLFVCYLGAQTVPTNRQYQFIACPNDGRPSVSPAECCARLRTVPTGPGVPAAAADAIRGRSCP